jgi:hypothetical protein
MPTHVFIVNDETFPVHLRYLFAGTGAGESDQHPGLLADILRVRPGDFVIFYIEGTTRVKGVFSGIYRISTSNPSIRWVQGTGAYQPGLPIKLIYRVSIEPYEVYAKGVPEYEALDRLPMYATDIQWTLIYRKLKGKRGCTPLLPWESQRLVDMIRDRNDGRPLVRTGFQGTLGWDPSERVVTLGTSAAQPDFSGAPPPDCTQQLRYLADRRHAYEVYLQQYFTQNIGREAALEPIVGRSPDWFGNEIPCGVGMQKIDILSIAGWGTNPIFRIIELKDEAVTSDIIDQITYYVTWASESDGRHLIGARHWNIQPVVVAPPHKPRTWDSVIRSFKEFNGRKIALPIEYYEFFLTAQGLTFTKIDYQV